MVRGTRANAGATRPRTATLPPSPPTTTTPTTPAHLPLPLAQLLLLLLLGGGRQLFKRPLNSLLEQVGLHLQVVGSHLAQGRGGLVGGRGGGGGGGRGGGGGAGRVDARAVTSWPAHRRPAPPASQPVGVSGEGFPAGWRGGVAWRGRAWPRELPCHVGPRCRRLPTPATPLGLTSANLSPSSGPGVAAARTIALREARWRRRHGAATPRRAGCRASGEPVGTRGVREREVCISRRHGGFAGCGVAGGVGDAAARGLGAVQGGAACVESVVGVCSVWAAEWRLCWGSGGRSACRARG